MPFSFRNHRQCHIESYEEMVLLSASGMEIDSDVPAPMVEFVEAELFELQDPNGEVEELDLLELELTSIESTSEVELEFLNSNNDIPTNELNADDSLELFVAANTALPESAIPVAAQSVVSDQNAPTSPAPFSQFIVLNGQDNDAILEDHGTPDDGLVQLRSSNGTFETIVFQMPTHELVIELGDGDDQLVIGDPDLGVISANLVIFGQGGNDNISFGFLETPDSAFTVGTVQTLGDVFIDDSDGDNELTILRSEIGGSLFINDGDGDQTFLLRGTVEGDISITSTDGSSSIQLGQQQIEFTRIGGSVTIDNQGDGSDDIQLAGRINGDFYIDAGDGLLDLGSIFSTVDGSLFTSVGNGSFTTLLGDFSVGEHASLNTQEGDTNIFLTQAFFNDGLTINNGIGFDRLRIDGVQFAAGGSAVPAASRPAGNLTVNNGDGGSLTTMNLTSRIFGVEFDQFRMTNGAGTDTFEFVIRDQDNFGTFFADNGDGDVSVDISGAGAMDSVTFLSGDGDDSFVIDGPDITNDLTINSGLGNRTIDIQNSTIGNTNFTGQSSTEMLFGDEDDEIFASLGNNLIDGGGGEDVLVVYEGTSNDFEIRREDNGRVIVEGPGLNGTTVRNELLNVERIRFNDREIFLDEEDGAGPPTIDGTDGDDWIAVSERGGNVNAGDGNDAIYAPFSQTVNEIDGGDGIDTLVIYQGNRADYVVRQSADDATVEIEGPGLNQSIVTNRLNRVEFVQFNDGRVAVADLVAAT